MECWPYSAADTVPSPDLHSLCGSFGEQPELPPGTICLVSFLWCGCLIPTLLSKAKYSPHTLSLVPLALSGLLFHSPATSKTKAPSMVPAAAFTCLYIRLAWLFSEAWGCDLDPGAQELRRLVVSVACQCFFPLKLGLWVSVAQHPQVLMWLFPPRLLDCMSGKWKGICAAWDLLLRLLLRLWVEGEL